jgi:enediyne biosynthesis protein E4
MHSDMLGAVGPDDWAAAGKKSDSLTMPAALFPEGRSSFVLGNALFSRPAKSTGTYREASDSLGLETYWPWGPSVDDVNADGWDDVLITAGMSFPFRYAPNSLLLNEGGKHFLPAEFTLGLEPRARGWSEWFSVDCNGAEHEHPACAQCRQPEAEGTGCQQTAPGKLTMLGSRSSRSSVIADFDGDGDLDIVTNEFNHAPMIFFSDLTSKRTIDWLEVRLRGTKSNRQGIGAEVTVVLPNGRRLLKVADGKSGYLSQSDLPLYFGLGDQERATSIEVLWPSGTRQTLVQPRSRQVNEVVESVGARGRAR